MGRNEDEEDVKVERVSLVAVDATPSGGIIERPLGWGQKRHLGLITRKQKGTFPKKGKFTAEPDPYDKEPAVPEESLKRHDTGADLLQPSNAKTVIAQKKLALKKKKFKERHEITARAEILNREHQGFLEADEDEITYTITQKELASAVDLASATKQFDLHLEKFGPYHLDYTDNGRHLLIGGKRGHIAAFDWLTKELHCEISVLEGVRDVKWLHMETMFAVAQKNYTYIYDSTGTELHCLKTLHDVRQLEFLPRHFLLVAGSNTSYLHYVDVSIGKMVQSVVTRQGPLNILAQNPANAIIHAGHGNGTVTLWSPNSKEPLVKLLAHQAALSGLAVDQTGTYMVSSGLDRKIRVWDVRMYKQLYAYSLPFGLSRVAVSQKMTVAAAVGNTVQVFRDMHTGMSTTPYLAHRCPGPVADLSFVPYEDVLGVGHAEGLTSLLVPGSGEANIDALRANPYETKSQRREREVRQLLDKIQPELINLDPQEINRINTELLEEDIEKKKSILWVKAPEITYVPRHKAKGRSKASKMESRKQGVRGEIRQRYNEEKRAAEKEVFGSKEDGQDTKPKSVLDRFRRKD